MKGYGYSLWAVPDCHKELAKQYGMCHIPHVTIETNSKTPLYANVGKRCVISFKHGCHIFPSMYEHDIFQNSVGFYCELDGAQTRGHNPHMTVFYRGEDCDVEQIKPPKGSLHATIQSADTRSEDPAQWNVLTPDSRFLLCNVIGNLTILFVSAVAVAGIVLL